MNRKDDGTGAFFGWVKRQGRRLRKWISGVKIWQWALAIAILELTACIWVLPPLGRWLWGIEGGFWDGLERFGGITGLITLGISFLSFINTKRILDYRTSDYQTQEGEQSNEAFDLFVRVSERATDTASMDDFLKHCRECCPLEGRSWPKVSQDGREFHLARLFEDNNKKGFQSSFHQELFATFGGDADLVKQRFMELLQPVVIRYGSAAIREHRTAAVYFLPKGADPDAEQQVAGERIVEIHFPMDLPTRDAPRRQAFLAYFAAVMQLLFRYLHDARLCYQGPAMLPSILGSITDNEHTLEGYQYDRVNRCYYRVGSSDHKALIASFLDSIR